MTTEAQQSWSPNSNLFFYSEVGSEVPSLSNRNSNERSSVSEVAKGCFDQLGLSSDEIVKKKRTRSCEENCMSKRLCIPQKKSVVAPKERRWDREDDTCSQFTSYSLFNPINLNKREATKPNLMDTFRSLSLISEIATQEKEIELLNVGKRTPEDFNLYTIQQIVNCFGSQCSKIKKLDLTGYAINPEAIKLLSQHFTSLESLCLSGCGLQKALPFIGELENLIELDLSNNPDLETLNGLETLTDGETCSKLSYVNISNTSIQNINALIVHINLKKIDMQNCKQIRDAVPIQYLSNLSHLNMNGCDNLKCDIAIFKKLFELEHLDFGKCPEISGTLNDLGNLKKLKHLNVGYLDSKEFSCADDLPHLEIVISEPESQKPQKPRESKKETRSPKSTGIRRTYKNQANKQKTPLKYVSPRTVRLVQNKALLSGFR